MPLHPASTEVVTAATNLPLVFIALRAAALQATRLVSFVPAFPLDHNGVFHLVQVPGLLGLLAGLQKTLGGPVRTASNDPRRLAAPQPRT